MIVLQRYGRMDAAVRIYKGLLAMLKELISVSATWQIGGNHLCLCC
jgi:hypothetical protein